MGSSVKQSINVFSVSWWLWVQLMGVLGGRRPACFSLTFLPFVNGTGGGALSGGRARQCEHLVANASKK